MVTPKAVRPAGRLKAFEAARSVRSPPRAGDQAARWAFAGCNSDGEQDTCPRGAAWRSRAIVSTRVSGEAAGRLSKWLCQQVKPPSAAFQGEGRRAGTRDSPASRSCPQPEEPWRANHGAAAIGAQTEAGSAKKLEPGWRALGRLVFHRHARRARGLAADSSEGAPAAKAWRGFPARKGHAIGCAWNGLRRRPKDAAERVSVAPPPAWLASHRASWAHRRAAAAHARGDRAEA
jgi:hypothetical protein